MAKKTELDIVWEDIFDTLTVDGKPPAKYIKSVLIITKDGERRNVSGKEFSEMLENESFMSAGSGNIVTCRLSIDFAKVRRDVDRWADKLIEKYDNAIPVPGAPEKKRRIRKKAIDDNLNLT